MLQQKTIWQPKCLKLISAGFILGCLQSYYKAYLKNDGSLALLNYIRRKSLYDNDYYKVYYDLSKSLHPQQTHNILALIADSDFKLLLINSVLCCVVGVASTIASTVQFVQSPLVLSLLGGIINISLNNNILGDAASSDFIFGMLAALTARQIAQENDAAELDAEVLQSDLLL